MGTRKAKRTRTIKRRGLSHIKNNRKDSHRIEATEKASWDQANQGEILGMTRRQEKTVGLVMTVSLYRSSSYLCYGHKLQRRPDRDKEYYSIVNRNRNNKNRENDEIWKMARSMKCKY
jgi:hypothetical protein